VEIKIRFASEINALKSENSRDADTALAGTAFAFFLLKIHPDPAELSLMAETKIDPLYTIFEQHLFNFQDPNSDRKSFIDGIVKDYLSQVRRMGLSVPTEWEAHINEELSFQVNTMLVKKIYGCLTIEEYQTKLSPVQKKRAKARYRKLQSA
jgi:hypothetical protein